MAENRGLWSGISGASGVAYGIRLLEALKELGTESHLVVTKPGEMTIGYETASDARKRCRPRPTTPTRSAISAAPIASGSFKTRGMIVAPCSVRTMSEIATGVTTNLLTRAADVTLKERRPLILLVRETPLHLGHLRTLTQLAEIGAIILPPVPAFYAGAEIDFRSGRSDGRRAMLDLLGYDWPMPRWGEDLAKGRRKGRKGGMTDAEEETLRAKLADLMQEHRDLDAAIAAMAEQGVKDQLQVTRLKKRKLQLKDQITRIEDALLPDIIA